MSITEFGLLILEHKTLVFAGIIVLLSSIQISPLKINPWSWILKCFRKLNGVDVVEEKIDHLSESVVKLEDRVDEGQAIQARVRILRFGDEIRNSSYHSKDSYEQVLDDITRYNQYCEMHPKFKNDMTVLTSQIIEESYKERLLRNDFL